MNGELVLAARFRDGIEVPIQLADAEGYALMPRTVPSSAHRQGCAEVVRSTA